MYHINKIVITCLFIALLSSCEGNSDQLNQLNWLVGEWQQVNANGDKISLESWSTNHDQMNGTGYTIRREPPYDTLFTEQLTIVNENNQLFYLAKIPNQKEVRFKLTSFNKSSWSFSNPKHNYPKIITYKKTATGFTAEVGDLKKTNRLEFQPIKR